MDGVETNTSPLYVVELRTRGWAVGVSRSEEERVLTTIFRLSKNQKNRLQQLKVKFYRVLAKYSVLRLGDKYVIPLKNLPEVERRFLEIQKEFNNLRREIFLDIVGKWDNMRLVLRNYALKHNILPDRIEKLKPDGEDFIDMYYLVFPLKLNISQMLYVSEELEKLAKERDEYKSLAARLKNEAENMTREIKTKYEEKIRELNKVIEQLNEAVSKQSKEIYRLRLKAREIASEASEVASFLGEETIEDLKSRLEALKEFFTT